MSTDGEVRLIVERLEAAAGFDEAAGVFTDWAKNLTGCEAAMLRMVEAQDEEQGWIPALVYRGLTPRFLQDEVLVGDCECLCGHVCQGCGDSELPFFTQGGSFVWGGDHTLTAELLAETFGEMRGRCLAEGYESLAICPLVADGRRIGVLHLADRTPEKFTAHVEVLEAACHACGPLLLRHEERERALIRALEAALLPREILSLPSLELAIAFSSATEAAGVGGDFYDVRELESGDVLLFLGDCAGKGIDTAGMAARVRQGVSNLAQTNHDPAVLLAEADKLIAELVPNDKFVTLVVCRFNRDRSVSAAVAGHPRPLRLSAGGEAEEIESPRHPPLGVVDSPYFATETVPLTEEEVVLLYTDGISEARREGELFGIERIQETWSGASEHSLSQFVGLLVKRSSSFHAEGIPPDDRLALAVRFRS